MRALLLAAGFGTRLRPLTDTIPKCLVPIKGQPLLDIWLEQLTAAGVGPFLINTHYLHESVEEYVNNCKYKDQITLVYEPILLGTAGTLKANADFFKEQDGMLIHADNYCIADFKSFLQTHLTRPDTILATMMSFRTMLPSQCGILEIDQNNIVVDFHEKVANPPGNLANGAVYILSAELIQTIKEGNFADFSTEIIPDLMNRIISFENTGIHIDIGSPQEYDRAQSAIIIK